MQTYLEWHRTTDRLPDDDILVLCAHDGDTYAGWLDTDAWRYADAMPASVPQWWAHMPEWPRA